MHRGPELPPKTQKCRRGVSGGQLGTQQLAVRGRPIRPRSSRKVRPCSPPAPGPPALTGRGLRSEGRRRRVGARRAGGSGPQPRSAPLSTSCGRAPPPERPPPAPSEARATSPAAGARLCLGLVFLPLRAHGVGVRAAVRGPWGPSEEGAGG